MTEQRDLLGMPEGQEAIDLALNAPLEVPESRWAGNLASMVAVTRAAYLRMGMDEDVAAKLATAAVLAQAEYMGGRQLYLPKGDRLRRALRDAEIFHRAHRGNIDALATEFGLTDSQVYRINREQRALFIATRQGRFSFEPKGES